MKLFIILAIALFSFENISAQAPMGSQMPPMKDGQMPPPPKEKKPKKLKEKDIEQIQLEGGKVDGQVYMFGFSEQFGDSIVYISPICKVDSIAVVKKMLPYRSDFSEQFRLYLEKHKGCVMQTSSVFFSDNRKKLAKTYYKLKKRYLEKDGRKMEILEDKEFEFVHPLDNASVE